MASTFLILDDDHVFAATLGRALTRRGFEVTVTHTGNEALQAAHTTAFQYVTIDLYLEHDSGLHWVSLLRHALPEAGLLILTGYASIATAVQAVKSGADDYLAKPANVDAILSALHYTAPSIPETALPAEAQPFSVNRLEWEHIQRVLTEHGGNISSTARALNMHRRTLQRKLAKRPTPK